MSWPSATLIWGVVAVLLGPTVTIAKLVPERYSAHYFLNLRPGTAAKTLLEVIYYTLNGTVAYGTTYRKGMTTILPSRKRPSHCRRIHSMNVFLSGS